METIDSTTTDAVYTPPTEEKKAFLAALAAAQGEFLPVAREREVIITPREGKPYSFKYAELAVIFDAVRPALAKNGLSIRAKVLPSKDAGHVWLQSILGHAEGYEDVSEMHVQVAGDLKTFGGQLSYIRRYLASPQLGIASEDDIDNNGRGAGEGGADNGVTGTGNKAPAPRARPQPAPRPAAAPAKTIAGKPDEVAGTAIQRGEALAPAAAPAPTPEGDRGPAAQPEEPTGEVITDGQAKWITGKLGAYFTPAEATQWLLQRKLPDEPKLIPAARFDEVRSALLAL